MKRSLIVAVIATAAVCVACTSKTDNSAMLSAHEWMLDEIVYDGNDFTETPPTDVTIIFADSTGRVSGNGGCNHFSGTYKLSEENKIVISAPAATLRACLDMEFESKYFKLLEKINEYKVDESSLELKAASEKTTLRYKPVLKAEQ